MLHTLKLTRSQRYKHSCRLLDHGTVDPENRNAQRTYKILIDDHLSRHLPNVMETPSFLPAPQRRPASPITLTPYLFSDVAAISRLIPMLFAEPQVNDVAKQFPLPDHFALPQFTWHMLGAWHSDYHGNARRVNLMAMVRQSNGFHTIRIAQPVTYAACAGRLIAMSSILCAYSGGLNYSSFAMPGKTDTHVVESLFLSNPSN